MVRYCTFWKCYSNATMVSERFSVNYLLMAIYSLLNFKTKYIDDCEDKCRTISCSNGSTERQYRKSSTRNYLRMIFRMACLYFCSHKCSFYLCNHVKFQLEIELSPVCFLIIDGDDRNTLPDLTHPFECDLNFDTETVKKLNVSGEVTTRLNVAKDLELKFIFELTSEKKYWHP